MNKYMLMGRLSTVKRWAIVPTLRQQSVAEHSYNVCILVSYIMSTLAPVHHRSMIGRALELALEHDADEAITGDVPATAKFIGYTNANALSDSLLSIGIDLISSKKTNPNEWFYVKLADILEALWFINTEIAMGNTTLADISNDISDVLNTFININQSRFNELMYKGQPVRDGLSLEIIIENLIPTNLHPGLELYKMRSAPNEA